MKKFLVALALICSIVYTGSFVLAATNAIPTPIALFETSLASGITSTATSMTLVSATDKDGNALSGSYAFILDEGTANEEFVNADCTATACTNMSRGLSVVTGTTSITALKKEHRRGASVKITDAPQLLILHRIINGISTFPNKLSYTSHPTFTADTEIVDKKYVDDVAIAGGVDASTTTKGITKLSTAPASSTNPIAVGDNDPRVPTTGENDALVGTSGTPSSSNKYVTNDDTATAATASKVARRLASGDITVNTTPTNATDAASKSYVDSSVAAAPASSASYTASGSIAANDSVYVSAANTVKTLYPSAQGTGSSIAQATSHMDATMAFPLSVNGTVLHFSGGDAGSSGASPLYAQVITINAAETNFSNGSEQTVYSTGNGTNSYDVKKIDTDKFLVIWQSNTAGSGAGIKAAVLTVSGTTITQGSTATIESTGNTGTQVAIAKADTDKAVIFYKKDSDGKPYMQVLTVSGDTITTNTPVKISDNTGTTATMADQITTNKVLVVYSDASATGLNGRTIDISGTTPTANSEQTLVSGSTSYTIGLKIASSTQALLCYSNPGGSVNDKVGNITISGNTLTLGSVTSLGSNLNQLNYFGMYTISTKYAMVSKYSSNTNIIAYLLDTSTAASAPTILSQQNLTSSDSSGIQNSTSMTKISPWTYRVAGSLADSDYIIKLTPVSTNRIGLASAAISNAASGSILYRYFAQTLSGTTLTAASTYYIDDTSQPTSSSSLTAPTLGISISTTKMLVQ